MDVRFQIEKENRTIVCIVAGQLNRDILINLLTQLRIITSNNIGNNLLFDLRLTSLEKKQMDMHRVIDFVSAIINMRGQLGDKVAHVVPVDQDRINHAEDIGSVATIRGIDYQVFTDAEKARDWLMA
jgi:hypothetical protein